MSDRSAFVALAILLLLPLATSAQDHLEPEGGNLNMADWQWKYSKELRDVLLKDAAHHHLARMVCLPSFSPEWVVTVVREDGEDSDAEQSYFVEYVGAEKKLFSRSDISKIKVKRSRAKLDGKTAQALNKVWRRMLRTTRYPDEPRLGADGVSYHFSRSVPNFDRGRPDPLAGWEAGRIWTPDDESVSGRFVAIGESLKMYALAQPKERDKLRLEIQAKTDELSVRLDRSRQQE